MAKIVRLTPDRGGELDRPILGLPKTSADADVPPESVGQDLCKARHRSGKTLMEVWHETKIPPHHLIAIETSRFEALPGRVYAIGFVRSYSAYLGLDAEAIVARLRAEMAGPDAKLPIIGSLPPPERKDLDAECAGSGDAKELVVRLLTPPERKLPHSVIAGLLIAVLVYSGYYVLASAGRMAQPPVMPVPARLAAEAGLTQRQVDAPPLATVEQPARTSGEPALASSTEVASTQPLLVRPLATVEPPATFPTKPALAPTTEVAPTQPVSVRPLPTVEPAPASPPELALPPPSDAAPTQPVAAPSEPRSRFHAPLPLGQRYGIENGNTRIILRVHRSIRLAVQGTGNRIFIDRILDPGDTYRVPNLVGLKLSAPDAGAIEVILDDTTVGFAGKDGAMVRDLSLEPQSIIDRQQNG
jgi:cytoskeleton protein RodZ